MSKVSLLFTTLFLLIAIQCQQGKAQTNSPDHYGGEINPENALIKYLHNSDESYGWEIEHTIDAEGVTIYQITLTSQTWKTILWKHSLSIIVPQTVNPGGALLFISGGNNRNAHLHPDIEDKHVQAIAEIAQNNQAITALIKQVPNQPLFGGKTEDALISYTLHNYREDGDFTWPLLFPMTKSVVRAMDAIQEFSKKNVGKSVDQFLLTGYSKRGWTTWLAGANDKRVKAIAPSVIDVLNMPLNVDYQVKTWGDYSVEIQDYVRLGIAQDINTPVGQELVTMIDPFSYRKTLTMPKLILIGTNDPYWPVDAVKNYFDQLPGKNYIFYTPNAGHDLNDGSEATPVLSEFFNKMLSGFSYPKFQYDYKADAHQGLSVSIRSDQPVEYVEQWTVHSTDRDFRDDKWSVQKTTPENNTQFTMTMSKSSEGYSATYWNVIYKGNVIPEYPMSTRMFVMGKDSVYLEPME